MKHTDKVGILPGEQIKLTLVQSGTIAANYTASGNTPPSSSPLTVAKNKGHPQGVSLFLAQEEGFEPPCLLGKRFSRPPRCDRFDIPAYYNARVAL